MAWFKHACFLSYRHGQPPIKERLIRQLHDGLAAELELLRPEGIFVDYERLKGGQFLDPNVERALYESACMIMVYHPTYFDLEHTYCAREYLGMVALEQHRLSLLPPGPSRENGLIIPIVLRGAETLPTDLSRHRLYEDFSRLTLADVEQGIKTYAPQIRSIAAYVHERCADLSPLAIPPHGTDFQLPSDEHARTWLDSLRLPRPRFPGTEA